MLHTKFRGNRPTGSGEKNFKGFFTIYGRGGHLGHVTSIILIKFHFLYLKAYIQKLVKMARVVSEKSKF